MLIQNCCQDNLLRENNQDIFSQDISVFINTFLYTNYCYEEIQTYYNHGVADKELDGRITKIQQKLFFVYNFIPLEF